MKAAFHAHETAADRAAAERAAALLPTESEVRWRAFWKPRAAQLREQEYRVNVGANWATIRNQRDMLLEMFLAHEWSPESIDSRLALLQLEQVQP